MRAALASALLAALAVSAAASTARADLVAPGYKETCTMEKVRAAGKECLECRAFFGNPEHCSASLQSYGFTQACRTGGASTWGEIWCRASSPSAAKVPPDVLGQLSNPSGGIKPDASAKPTAMPAPTAAPVATGTPAPPATGAPAPAASGAPAPSGTNVPGPQPTPPPQGCACSLADGGEGPLAASLLAMCAAAVTALRRRRVHE
jgi:hypothetical protein